MSDDELMQALEAEMDNSEVEPEAAEETLAEDTSLQSPEPETEQPAEVPSIEVGGTKYTSKEIEELRASGLRYADYTRKTQALAAERKELEKRLKESDERGSLYGVEREELEEWRRIDQIIMSSTERQEAFKQLLQGATSQAERRPEVPKELSEEIEYLRAEAEDRRIDKEMGEVYGLVGKIDRNKEIAFLNYASRLQEKMAGEVPLVDAARMFFYDDLVQKRVEALTAERDKRTQNASKVKVPKGGTKSSKGESASTDPDEAFLADIMKVTR